MCAIVIYEITVVHSLILAGEAGALPPRLALGLFRPEGLISKSAPNPSHGQIERAPMVSRQLELGLANQPCCQSAGRRRGRGSRAHWWFERMRGVVSGAPDWEPAPVPEETPRPTEVQAKPDPLDSQAASRTSNPGPVVSTPNSEPVLEAPRWKFPRTRRLLWE